MRAPGSRPAERPVPPGTVRTDVKNQVVKMKEESNAHMEMQTENAKVYMDEEKASVCEGMIEFNEDPE